MAPCVQSAVNTKLLASRFAFSKKIHRHKNHSLGLTLRYRKEFLIPRTKYRPLFADLR